MSNGLSLHRYALLQFDPGPQLLAAVAQAAQQHLQSAEPKDLVFLLWSFAKLAARPLVPQVSAFVEAAHQPLLVQLLHPQTQLQVSLSTTCLARAASYRHA